MPAVVFGLEHFLYMGITATMAVIGLICAKKFAKSEYFYNDYDFDVNLLDEEDYFFISNRENKESYKSYKTNYEAFDLYYFDTQSKTLYFLHSNI